MKHELEIKAEEINEYWDNLMPLMCTEEAGELIQAISKAERAREKYDNAYDESYIEAYEEAKESLMREMADMFIVLLVLKSRYDLDDDRICDMIDEKISKKY